MRRLVHSFRQIPLPVAIGIGFLLLANACGNNQEIAAAIAPTGDVYAVLTEYDGGATTDFYYDLYLAHYRWIRIGSRRVASMEGDIRCDGPNPYRLRWTGKRELLVEYGFLRPNTLLDSAPQYAGNGYRIVLRPCAPNSDASDSAPTRP